MTLALDTEFVWERTYYANLGLIQVAFDAYFDSSQFPDSPPVVLPFTPVNDAQRSVRLIDPLKGGKKPLAKVLSDPSVVKILHDSGQDLQHLHRWCGALPKTIFDTRVAAGFCGMLSTLSLRQLLIDTVAIELPKTETRTNWLRRPLSEAQLLYAADDVAYMDEVKTLLEERAHALGNFEWMMEEMQTLDDPSLYTQNGVEDAWKRMKVPVTAFKTDRQRVRLRVLATWREETAIERNLPRSWVVGDKELVAAALNPPETPEKLPPRTVPKAFQEAFFAVLEAAEHAPEEDVPEFTPLASAEQRKQATAVMKVIEEVAKTRHVDTGLFGSRADVTAFCQDPENPEHQLNRGWRKEALGDKALNAIGI